MTSVCRRVLEGLQAAGVLDLVVSPGSRSTPLLLAALDSPLRLHSVIDERSAAFFALGMARSHRRPVALLCTSGSAAAHYLPALLEARYAEHRVIAVTADRPAELHDSGANQTIDQRALLVAACGPCLEFQEADSEAAAGAGRRVYQRIAQSPGPVHINLAFRKPLEAGYGQGAGEPLHLAPLHPTCAAPSEEALSVLASAMNQAERILFVGGWNHSEFLGDALLELAERSGAVLLAESTSGARFTGSESSGRCDAYGHVLASAALAADLQPDLVVRFGGDLASAPLGRFLAATSARRIRLAPGRLFSDAAGAEEVVLGDPTRICRALQDRVRPGDTSYRQEWRAADARAWAAVEACLPLHDEARATADAVAALPPGTQLTVGNSLPIRTLDAVLPGHRAHLRILHQRGTSGIDGLIAGAIGSSDQSFSALLLGDVSCSHDLSSLALARHARGPLAIVVLDNQGGQIFSHLPVANIGLDADAWRLWQTPPSADLEHVCRGYGVSYRRESEHPADAVAWAQAQEGVSLIHLPVAPASAHEFLQAVQARLS